MTKPVDHPSFDRSQVTEVAKEQMADEMIESRKERVEAVKMILRALVPKDARLDYDQFRAALIRMKATIETKIGHYPNNTSINGVAWQLGMDSYEFVVDGKEVNVGLVSRVDEEAGLELKLSIPSTERDMQRIKMDLDLF